MAVSAGLVFGIGRALTMSVSMGPGRTARSENDAPILGAFWAPVGRAARRSPGFAEFARKIGYADLWDRYGPPDGCRRVAPRDYACD